jgi:hypothetical protein
LIDCLFTLLQILVRQIQEHSRNPPLRECAVVASKIVQKYPCTFLDVDDDGLQRGSGCASLAEKIRRRLCQVNLNDVDVRLRSQRRSTTEAATEEVPSKRRTLAQSFGCINWQPEILESEVARIEEEGIKLKLLYDTEGPLPSSLAQV